ncbi:MAG TPA: hypothetical protein VNF24_08295 [Candidatus Acidoferrales bacterium]|nr:hypothetical protein [Candidatus Acidoferrales bacterium]
MATAGADKFEGAAATSGNAIRSASGRPPPTNGELVPTLTSLVNVAQLPPRPSCPK